MKKAIEGESDTSVIQPEHQPAADRSSADERSAAGKSLRDKVPRQAHGVWKRPAKRAEPLAILRASDEGRLPQYRGNVQGCPHSKRRPAQPS
jgi:hypothetical protein